MSKKIYIFSTLAADVSYTGYAENKNDAPARVAVSVVVKGGAGVANRRTLETPRGVVTEVTQEQAEFLSAHPVFKKHLQNGFVQVSELNATGDEAAADLNGRDPSAPLVEQDFTEQEAQPQGAKKPSKRK